MRPNTTGPVERRASRDTTLLSIVAVFAICAVGAAWTRDDTVLQSQSLAGAWVLRTDANEAPQERFHTSGGQRRNGLSHVGADVIGFQTNERARILGEALLEFLEIPEQLTIVQTDSMVIIQTSTDRTTRLSTAHRKITDESTKLARRTHWNAGTLVSKIAGLPSGPIVETYSLDAQDRLHITLKFPNKRLAQSTRVHRVYDRKPQ